MKAKHKNGFTLAELIVAIALLSVFGVIVARMYFLSDRIANKTEQLDRAVVLASNITERWQALPVKSKAETDLSLIFFGTNPVGLDLAEFIEDRQEGMSWQSFLDAKMRPCEESEAIYLIDLVLVQNDKAGVWSLLTSIREFGNSGQLLYTLQGDRYFAGEALP